MTEFTIYAPELARLTHNAMAFMPARSAVKVCRIMHAVDAIAVTATDLFTVGKDEADVTASGEEVFATIDLSREDLQALDKAARAAKKEDVQVTIRHQDGMEFKSESESLTFLDSSALRQPVDLWELCDEMLSRPTPDHLCLIDPKFMSAFGKVKASGGAETIADLSIIKAEPDDDGIPRISVKIGSTFRGAIMPVDRGEAAESESIGVNGLWSDEKVDS